MSQKTHGELVPLGGGDAIPLIRNVLVIGRRATCDVCLRYPNVSSQHCRLEFEDGYWWVRDLDSTNGVKVNDVRVRYKHLLPGDTLSIAGRRFTIHYQLMAGRKPLEDTVDEEDVMAQSLLQKAGLERLPTPVDEDAGDDDRPRKRQ